MTPKDEASLSFNIIEGIPYILWIKIATAIHNLRSNKNSSSKGIPVKFFKVAVTGLLPAATANMERKKNVNRVKKVKFAYPQTWDNKGCTNYLEYVSFYWEYVFCLWDHGILLMWKIESARHSQHWVIPMWFHNRLRNIIPEL